MTSPWIHLIPASLPETIQIFYSPTFQGERGDDSRKDLRLQLREKLASFAIEAPDELLDLNRRPFHSEFNLSISHCKDAAMIGWVDKPLKIGVDVEQIARIESHLVRRVSTPEEISEAPRHELLWSAKEAAFKSRSEAVQVISSVEVFDWRSLGDQTWSFRTRVAQSKEGVLGSGEIRLISNHTAAFFLADH